METETHLTPPQAVEAFRSYLRGMETGNINGHLVTIENFDPTYEAWKRQCNALYNVAFWDFDPTYEAWKPSGEACCATETNLISILPTRHGNNNKYCNLDHLDFYFDPTYEAWKRNFINRCR